MPAPKEVPTQFGRYQVLEEVGAGAMGVVYRCHDPGLNRTVAVKVMRESEYLTPVERAQYEARFRHEAEAAGRLSHPDIVQIYDVGPSYLVMEHLEGRTLAALLRHGPRLSVRQACDIVARVGDAIDHAHRHGIVHRDIKPANVMLVAGGGVKVMDFGVARLDSSTLTVLGTVVGSVRYMSPEQMMGERVDGRADVFSLGAVAYEMLTGQAPFPGKTVTEVVSRVVRGAYVPPGQADARLPEALNTVFARAFAPRPEARLVRARDFALQLKAAAESVLDLEVGGDFSQEATPTRSTIAPTVPPLSPTIPMSAAPMSETVFMSAPTAAREAALSIDSDPPEADVDVDGRRVGRTPLVLELGFGRHSFRLEAAGRQAATAAIELSADQPFQALSVSLPAAKPATEELAAFGPGVVPPRRIEGALPEYPEPARAVGLEGAASVELRIDDAGVVRSVVVRESAGRHLDEALAKAATGWRFAPATIRGEAVGVRLLVRHVFRLP